MLLEVIDLFNKLESNINSVSIIVLTYRNWKLLESAISSVSKQVLDGINLELLIVDDGTIDFDHDFVFDLIKKYNLYKHTNVIINKTNQGTVKSFNNAIKLSQGDIIIPLAADDIFYDDLVVGDIVRCFVKNKALIVTGLRVPFDDNGRYSALPKYSHRKFFISKDKLLKRIACKGNLISGASTYYHRELFNKYGYFSENYRLLEDYPYYLHILNEGQEIILMDRFVILYRLGGISSESSMSPILKSDFVLAYKFAATLKCVNFFQKRKILFNKVLSNKYELLSIIKYPEQYFLSNLSNFKKTLRK